MSTEKKMSPKQVDIATQVLAGLTADVYVRNADGARSEGAKALDVLLAKAHADGTFTDSGLDEALFGLLCTLSGPLPHVRRDAEGRYVGR